MKNYLEPIYGINRQKSFYKKAFIHYCNGKMYLQSYDTIVAMKDEYGNCYKTWNGYSKTTLEHVKAFFERNISKKEWDNMDILNLETYELQPTNIDTQYRVIASSGFCEYHSQARFAKSSEAEELCNRMNHGIWISWIE